MFRRKKLIIIFCIAVILVLSMGIFLRSQFVAPILMYHSVGPNNRPGNRCEISVESFERQMKFLRKHKYNVITLEELASLVAQKKRVPHRTVALTFDDGNKDNYIYVFPILKKYNLPATMFVIINEIGRAQRDRLSWSDIVAMQSSGLVTFGSHCLGPEPLINIHSKDLIKKEIFDSKRILENKLGTEVNAFSYPEGRFTDEIRKLVIDAGYKLAVATNPGKKFPNDDIFALKRLRISSTSDNLFVFWAESSGYYNFIREQRHK